MGEEAAFAGDVRRTFKSLTSERGVEANEACALALRVAAGAGEGEQQRSARLARLARRLLRSAPALRR